MFNIFLSPFSSPGNGHGVMKRFLYWQSSIKLISLLAEAQRVLLLYGWIQNYKSLFVLKKSKFRTFDFLFYTQCYGALASLFWSYICRRKSQTRRVVNSEFSATNLRTVLTTHIVMVPIDVRWCKPWYCQWHMLTPFPSWYRSTSEKLLRMPSEQHVHTLSEFKVTLRIWMYTITPHLGVPWFPDLINTYMWLVPLVANTW